FRGVQRCPGYTNFLKIRQLFLYGNDHNRHLLSFPTRRSSDLMTHGVTILANYTWSKSIDDLPPGGGVTDIGADSVSARPWDDPLRHQFDRGPSDFDRKHNFAASFIWQLPRLSKLNILARSILGHWQLGGIVSARTGRPLTIVSGTNRSGTGIGQDRAKLAGAALGPGSCAAAGITTV